MQQGEAHGSQRAGITRRLLLSVGSRLRLPVMLAIFAISLVSAARPDPAAAYAGPPYTSVGGGQWLTGLLTALEPSGQAQRVYLPLVATPATSHQLIDQALVRSEIDAETALIYHVYASFLDPKLPPKYRGVRASAIEDDYLEQVMQQYDKLSASAQQNMVPYLTPPIYEGSWADPSPPAAQSFDSAEAALSSQSGAAEQPCDKIPLPGIQPGWQKITTTHAHIWYQTAGDAPFGSDWVLATPEEVVRAAQYVAGAIETVWQWETGLMNRPPLPDAGEKCNGGDGLLDVYLTRRTRAVDAQAIIYLPATNPRPGYLWIAPDFAGGDAEVARDVLAHEFFHLLSATYPQARPLSDLGIGEYEWLDEATANYMIDYVYPDDQFEHRFAFRYFEWGEIDASLERGAHFGYNGYLDYLYPFFLARTINPSVIRSIWENTTVKDSLGAIEAATAGHGGFKTLWPRFARANWNNWQDGFLDDYYQWDELEAGMNLDTQDRWGFVEVNLQGASATRHPGLSWPGFVPHLGQSHERFVFKDPNVRSVYFWNGLTLARGANVRALIKLEGQPWQEEDWTQTLSRAYCRDMKSERLEELVIIASNSEWQNRNYTVFGDDFHLYVSNIGCWRWTGTATSTTYIHSFDTDQTETVRAQVTFQVVRSGQPASSNREQFWVVGGTATWNHTGVSGGCSGSGSGSFQLTPPGEHGPGSMTVVLQAFRGQEAFLGDYYGLAGPSPEVPESDYRITYHCPGGSTREVFGIAGPYWSAGQAQKMKVSKDGAVVEGKWTLPGMDGSYETWEWRFVAQRE